MQEHPNAGLIRHAYELFSTSDLDLLRVVFDDHVVWHQPGRGPMSGDFKGPDEVLGFLEKLQAASDHTFAAEIEAVLADCERAVVLQHDTARRGEAELDVLAASDFEIHHGKITEVTVYQDGCEFDEFWC